MDKKRLSVLTLILAAIACDIPATASPAPTAVDINVVVAQTINAALTQTAQVGTPIPPSETFTPTFTFTPTLSPTSTLTPTPLFTSTPLVPIISVSVATNCRNGPGKVYGYEGALLVGQTAEIIARDPTGNYWYIRNPEGGNGFCWVWGKYATISGNTAVLPIYTPPPTPSPTFTPTPAPDFQLSYASLDSCSGWWAEFKIKNTGAVDFKSIEITVRDADTGVSLTNLIDGFNDVNGCLSSTYKDTLAAGKATVISGPAFTYNPTGHRIHATVTLCSKQGLSGRCVTKKIEFIP